MPKLHFYKLQPDDILARIITMSMEERGVWITDFAVDLQRCNKNTAKTDLAKALIDEAEKFRRKKSESGRLGGLAKASTAKAKGKQNLASSSNNTKRYIVEAKEIISFLNDKTGKKFKHTTGETIKNISARLDEGYNVEDFKKAIENQIRDWLGTDMEKYLTPSTLFRPSNFEKYVNNVKIEKSKTLLPFNPNRGY